jgi:uncharacterized membrane protein YuzA (DUF378 family)
MMKNKSAFGKAVFILLLIGGLNWGLVGLGMLIGSNLNVVNLLVGQWPTVEAIVYLLVGLAAIEKIVYMATCCKS